MFFFKHKYIYSINWCLKDKNYQSNWMMFKLSCLGDLWKIYIFLRQKVKLDLYQVSPYNKTQTCQTQNMTIWLTFITNCNICREMNIAKYGKIFFQSYDLQSLVVSAVPCKLIANTLARARESKLFLLFSPPKNQHYC